MMADCTAPADRCRCVRQEGNSHPLPGRKRYDIQVAASVTALLKQLGGGDRAVLDELIPIVYRELHRIAEGYLQREPSGRTLQPTSLIHEAGTICRYGVFPHVHAASPPLPVRARTGRLPVCAPGFPYRRPQPTWRLGAGGTAAETGDRLGGHHDLVS